MENYQGIFEPPHLFHLYYLMVWKNFTNPSDIANGLNDFFVNIGHSLAKIIENMDGPLLENFSDQYPCLSMFNPHTPKEVHDIILELKDSSAGHDEIRSSLVKKIVSSITQRLTHVLTLSLKTGVVPAGLKLAKVIPLFKSGDSSLSTNYCPISILPCFSKILEKFVYSRRKKHG